MNSERSKELLTPDAKKPNKQSSETRFLRVAIVLGLLSAIGPFAIDMYLPALPSIGKDLAADPAPCK